MATFGELQSRIADKINKTDLTSQIATAINSTIDFYKNKRFWFTEATVTIVLNSGDPVVPNLPSDFGYEMPNGGLTIDFSNTRYPLHKVTEIEYNSQNTEGVGLPYIYRNRVDQLEVYFFPDRAYDLILYYAKQYADLVNSGDTNDWTLNADRLIEAKTLSDLYIDQRNDNELYQIYLQKAEFEERQLTRYNRSRVPTGTLITENIIDRGENIFYEQFI